MKSYYLGYTPKADQRAERARSDVAFLQHRLRVLPTNIEDTLAKLEDLKREAALLGMRDDPRLIRLLEHSAAAGERS